MAKFKISIHPGYILLIALGLVSNLSAQLMGRLYAGDAIMLLLGGAALLQIGGWLPSEKFARHSLFIILAFPIVAVLLDGANDIGFEWVAKGGARNTVFAMAVCASAMIIRSYGWKGWLGFILVVSLSPAILAIAATVRGEQGMDFIVVLKFFYGTSIFLAIVYFVRSGRFGAVAMVAFGALLAFAFDIRGEGTLFVVCGLAFFFKRLTKGWRFIPFLVMVVAVVVIGSTAVLSFFSNANTFDLATVERREESLKQRTDMAWQAWYGFLERPGLGHGSWQNAATYIDYSNPNEVIGVHSWILQFAFEYGLLGLAFGCLLAVVAARALFFWLQSGDRTCLSSSHVLLVIYFLADAVLNCCVSPFGGYYRIVWGLLIGAAICVNDLFGSRQQKGALLPFRIKGEGALKWTIAST
ncbi:MAG: O-antigen ligase family protein [Terrimicrobiaceae bacterium]|nr:O-antigen ligase family protein [Terrimicrobiaceae bacterium]